jgi:hypothetical protein
LTLSFSFPNTDGGRACAINRGQSNDETNFVWRNAGYEQIRECVIGPTSAVAVKFGTMEPEYGRLFILTLAENEEHSTSFYFPGHCEARALRNGQR